MGNLAGRGSTSSVTQTLKLDKKSSAKAQVGWGNLADRGSTPSIALRSKQRVIRDCDSCIGCCSTIKDIDLKSLVHYLLKETGKRYHARRTVKYVFKSKEGVTQDNV